MSEYRELLLGCGYDHAKRLFPRGHESWSALTTLDNDPNCDADIKWDLMQLPLPFPDETFDECHAYHTLEHLGQQGDFKVFFAQFEEFYRILKPSGFFAGIVPSIDNAWAFGDPGHSRVILRETLIFLDQEEYTNQVGLTAMCDYRRFYRADFRVIHDESKDGVFCFAMRAIKPSRISV